ncbi:YceD family protein [Loktanella sp. R86503]|uniref:YceD family protein n=1 Tax=Loktanella sp. R86503 TaxID=3093847 RepID=UPI0036DF8D5C
MTDAPELPTKILRLADLTNRHASTFDLMPTQEERSAIAAYFDIPAVKKLVFAGEITPLGRGDWQLTAKLGATVVQPCVATLAHVTTRLDEDVRRVYARDFAYPDGAEAEMPEDDAVEPLPQTLDLGAVMIEALSLALPAFPRAQGAELGQVLAAAEGIAPMTDDDAKPFAGLGALRAQLEKDADDSGENNA